MESRPPTHYEVLGIGPGATAEQVERAYRYSLELYGDGALATYSLLDPDEIRAARSRVQEAYEVLRDPVRRQAYDVSRGLTSTAALRLTPAPPAFGPAAPPPAAHQPPLAPAPAGPPAPPPRPAAPVEPAPPPRPRAPVFLPEPVNGAALRRFREERRISLRDIANQSKIGTRYLEYIEADRHDMLPAPVYLRGFLQEYARAVGLDPKRTADGYMAQFPRPWPEG